MIYLAWYSVIMLFICIALQPLSTLNIAEQIINSFVLFPVFIFIILYLNKKVR